MKKLKHVLAAAGLVLAGVGLAQAQITVGVTVSATGPAASLGIPERNTVALMPTSIAGQTVKYIVLDDATDPTAAARNVAKLTSEEKVDVIIGSSTVPTTLAAARTAREAQESAAEGPQWEGRVDLGSRHEAEALADRLAAEGLRPLRRWRHVFLSCVTEDEARALADRLRGEVPAGAELIVEGTAADAWELTHPFAILGGIAN